MQNEVPLFQKLYDFYQLFYELLDHFPKKSRPVLGQKIERTILEALESVSVAAYSSNIEKNKSLTKTSFKIDFLKILIRLAYETKTIDQKKYILLEEKLQEIGRMLGGWIKSIRSTNPDI